ncbi:hypothetical protein D3C72_1531310 [compost metagenome]
MLGEETHQGLGGLVRADDQAIERTGDCVLRHHALTGLDVAGREILGRLVHIGQSRRFQGAALRVDRGFDIHAHALIRRDEVHRFGRIVLVPLLAIGQSHGNEGC